MFLLLTICGSLAALLVGGLILFAAVTGEPPTPRRVITGLTRKVQALRQTLPYGRNRDGKP